MRLCQALSRVSNEIIAVVETTIKMKLDYPLHGELADPQPNAVESPYAGDSTPLIIATLRGVQQIFRTGLGDYLDYLAISPADVPLSKAIDAQIEESIGALEAIDLPLQKGSLGGCRECPRCQGYAQGATRAGQSRHGKSIGYHCYL